MSFLISRLKRLRRLAAPVKGTSEFRRAAQRGQNLVELLLTLPFLLVVVFAIIEFGRAWQHYEGAKMAAMDGAYTASVYQDQTIGQNQMVSRLGAARLTYSAATVQAVKNTNGINIGYEATVTVNYVPLFAGVSIPTLSGPISIIPNQFPITYNNVHYNSIQ